MSDADDRRERAIQLVYSLTLLAEHPNTPPHEAAAAQARIDHLRAKYKLAKPKVEIESGWDALSDAYARSNAHKRQAEQAAKAQREQKAKTDAVNAEWQRVYDAAKRRRAEEDIIRQAQEAQRDKDMFDEAQRKHGRTMQANRTKGNAKWNTSTKYHATITHVEDGYSYPMVTIDFLTDGQTFKGWYVKSNEYGLKALQAVLTTLLGAESVTWPLDRALVGLQGMSCTIMLDTWDKGGRQSFKVGTVMPRWS